MPLTWLKCPDSNLTPIGVCLSNCPNRCMTLPTLQLIASERVWAGTPSTTQLINGTMYEFLKLTQPYVVDPLEPERMAMLLGIMIHLALKDRAKRSGLPAEIPLTGEDRDIFDLLEPDDGGWTLTDYKVWGSYRVVRALGIVETGKMPDPSGEKYKSSGKWGKAGDPKQISVFQRMPQEADNWETELQLNRYRIMLEERGIKVNKMLAQFIVRDAGLAVAKGRGIEFGIYLEPVQKLDNEEIIAYFTIKTANLHLALEQGEWKQPCDNRECWDGRRCQDYCEVAMYCPKGMMYQGGK